MTSRNILSVPLLFSCSILTVALTACGTSTGPGATTPAPVTKTVVVTSAVSTTPRASAPVATSTPASQQTPGTNTSSSVTAPSTFVMPNEVGKVLQAAQDDIQRVSGNPVFFTASSDATGANRFQVLDSNWKVCAQNIAPGSRQDEDSNISFSVVKLTEQCR